MFTKKVEFPGSADQSLIGVLHAPVGRARASALFAHCFTCSKDVHAAVTIAEELASAGFLVLRFDFTGLGESSGEFADQTFTSNVGDIEAAARFLESQGHPARVLVGHSLGGTAVLAAAARLASVTAVATLGAPADPEHVSRLLADSTDEIAAVGEATVEIAGRSFRIKRELLDDLKEHSLLASVSSLGKALLICHAPRDQIVGIDNASRLFSAAKHPKSFVSLDDSDHLLSSRADARYAARMIASWSERYLEDSSSEESVEGVIVRAGPKGFAQHIQASHHRFRGDEPASVPGGSDTGPTPYDFLLAALGTCTSMTLRMYADRKGWPVEEITVELSHEKIHARDCEECETESGKIDRIDRRIEIAGPVDTEQRARLLEIADRCPVHKTLHSEIQVVTTEVL